MSDALRQAAYDRETERVFITLVTIDHADLNSPIRVTSDAVETTSRGNTFQPFPFDVNVPKQTEKEKVTVQLVIDNVDRQIVDTIRSISTEPSVTVEIVLDNDPDTVESGPFNFELKTVQWDKLTVSGELGFEDVENISFPAHRFWPGDFVSLS